MSRDQIAHKAAKIFLDTKSVLFNANEPFKYVSGNIGPVYVDCRRLISFPTEREKMISFAAEVLREEVGENNIDIIAGAETAGIPYASFISALMGKPMIYVRKKAKGHGRLGQIEGHFEEGKNPNVLLVEDLQNFGFSKKVFVEALRNAGATVDHFFVLFDYGTRQEVIEDNKNMQVELHKLANWYDVLEVARSDNYFDKETVDSVELYLNDPEEWTRLNADKVA
jgi:orotate phosphoribosyltransferase